MAQPLSPTAETIRLATIAWLIANDPNGCYRDDECVAEGLPILTLDEAISLIHKQTAPDGAS